MDVVDIFCNQLELIDNQTDAESLAFHYLPTSEVWVDELGFVCIQNESTKGCVRIGLKKDDSWCTISTNTRTFEEIVFSIDRLTSYRADVIIYARHTRRELCINLIKMRIFP